VAGCVLMHCLGIVTTTNDASLLYCNYSTLMQDYDSIDCSWLCGFCNGMCAPTHTQGFLHRIPCWDMTALRDLMQSGSTNESMSAEVCMETDIPFSQHPAESHLAPRYGMLGRRQSHS
jgi:hypothetical protein